MNHRKVAQKLKPLHNGLTVLSVLSPSGPFIGPTYLDVEVSARCNLTCLMCPYHSPLTDSTVPLAAGFMDLSLAERIFASASKLGTRTAVFVGRGEPMLHPKLGAILRFAKRAGLKTEVITNGTLLTRNR